jgi:hypothetical protein
VDATGDVLGDVQIFGNEKGGSVESRPVDGWGILLSVGPENFRAFRSQLAMTAATVASTAMETPATAAVEAIATVEAAAITTADEAVWFTTSVAVAAASIIAAVSVVAAAAVVTATTVEAMAKAAAEPGAGADEDATGEVVRPVVAVWSAGVRIVTVVTVGASRRGADRAVHGTHSNAHPNLGVSISRGKK